ncbi:MAG: hypothetical protein JW894_13040 [Bacteroidales bacterium]|nr:hypothetical protein [Bacteroidales bacterium]
MKKIIIYSLFLIFYSAAFSQTKEEALNAETITWFGIDFSQARFVDDLAFPSGYELRDKYFKGWNRLIISEPEKYDIPKYFHCIEIKTDLGDVYRRNEDVNVSDIIVEIPEGDNYKIQEGEIQKIIKDYKADLEGYGLVFIAESFDKPRVEGCIWVTYFHIPTKKVVFTRKLVGKPVGFGIRNYWAGAIADIMKQAGEEKSSW